MKNNYYFDKPIGLIGLGYVGLPLCEELSKKYYVIGYDKSTARINQLNKNFDATNQLSKNKLLKINKKVEFVSSSLLLKECKIYIITVPTPVYKNNKPDLRNILNATMEVSKIINKGDIIIYESTVFPGLTEEICIPLIEKNSNFKINKDFFVGYSPERINPGDKKYKLKNIIKITSASNQFSLSIIDKLYKSIIKAGTFKAKSIKVAESAKVIENAQRDINIAFMNELSVIFEKLNIDFNEILNASKTKWNFLDFKPGLVGGHCIGVDPYYLSYKSQLEGHKPMIILSGRKINNGVVNRIIKKFIIVSREKKFKLNSMNIIFLGCSFKENLGDTRNSLSIEIAKKLSTKVKNTYIFDPLISKKIKIKNIKFLKYFPNTKYDAIFITVPHDKILNFGKKRILKLLKKNGVLFDIKNKLNSKYSDFKF